VQCSVRMSLKLDTLRLFGLIDRKDFSTFTSAWSIHVYETNHFKTCKYTHCLIYSFIFILFYLFIYFLQEDMAFLEASTVEPRLMGKLKN